jgi:hypothetical protein
MNRRSFLATCTAAVAFLAYPLTGCDSTTVSEFVSLIGTDAAALATFFGAGSIATQITSLASQIAVDITNWQSGGAAADAIQAINDLIALVNTIPVATPYAPLIILILSALSGLLALLPSSATTANARVAVEQRHVNPMPLGGFDKHHMTAAKNSFQSQWNSQLAITPLTH